MMYIYDQCKDFCEFNATFNPRIVVDTEEHQPLSKTESNLADDNTECVTNVRELASSYEKNMQQNQAVNGVSSNSNRNIKLDSNNYLENDSYKKMNAPPTLPKPMVCSQSSMKINSEISYKTAVASNQLTSCRSSPGIPRRSSTSPRRKAPPPPPLAKPVQRGGLSKPTSNIM